jgi:hypothetical protein
MNNDDDESLQCAHSDVELLQAAYPDEITVAAGEEQQAFPLHVTLHLSPTAHMDLEATRGYPKDSTWTVLSYRSSASEKIYMEAALNALRQAALECQHEGREAGLACCTAALDAWRDAAADDSHGVEHGDNNNSISSSHAHNPNIPEHQVIAIKQFTWITGIPLVDRKSTFVAHACRITSESDVKQAVFHLLNGNSKLQRATHNMVRTYNRCM